MSVKFRSEMGLVGGWGFVVRKRDSGCLFKG